MDSGAADLRGARAGRAPVNQKTHARVCPKRRALPSGRRHFWLAFPTETKHTLKPKCTSCSDPWRKTIYRPFPNWISLKTRPGNPSEYTCWAPTYPPSSGIPQFRMPELLQRFCLHAFRFFGESRVNPYFVFLRVIIRQIMSGPIFSDIFIQVLLRIGVNRIGKKRDFYR